jgi:hypothetical protein
MERYDPHKWGSWIDDLMAQTTNPHHLAILKNYRRHGIFEVTGNWEWILAPDMTVDHPHYRFNVGGETQVLDGRDAVAELYDGLKQAGMMSTFGPIREEIMVADWGVAMHGLWGQQLRGTVALEQGFEIDDPDAFYNVNSWFAQIWRYNEDAKLIGEHVFEDIGSREIEKLDPADVMTAEEGMAPFLERLEEELAANPLPVAS